MLIDQPPQRLFVAVEAFAKWRHWKRSVADDVWIGARPVAGFNIIEDHVCIEPICVSVAAAECLPKQNIVLPAGR